jgi:CHAT domain-containing protein
VHIATHLRAAAACDEGRFSALGLELDRGQVICAAELARVRVTSPLVVLSACDTAGGRAIDARGRQGLARALFEGGARNLAVTLWPVADQAAAEFTRRFHGALGEGLEPSQAARRARVELREAGASSADWAAFRLAGRD